MKPMQILMFSMLLGLRPEAAQQAVQQTLLGKDLRWWSEQHSAKQTGSSATRSFTACACAECCCDECSLNLMGLSCTKDKRLHRSVANPGGPQCS